jgi:hypothetical protein
VFVLLALGRVPAFPALGVTIDLIFAAGFAYAYMATRSTSGP